MKEPPVKKGDLLADKYVVESVLGMGGMGIVVEAVHLELHESRAIKMMLPEALEEKESVERFMREARAASRLKSEHVAHVHDVGRLPNGAPYMVMEYLEGQDLRHLIKSRGKISIEEAVLYALQVCEALAEAHANGIVHRDLKPGNLFLTVRADGTPCIKVLDFGISKQPGQDDELTKTHAVLGSPSYMSPEQMRSARSVDARTDIWSLGVILFRLITGEFPYRGESMPELVTKVLTTAPKKPSAVLPDIPPDLEAVLLRCLERELSARWADVGELSAALLPFAPEEARNSAERIARVLAGHGRDPMVSSSFLTSSNKSLAKASAPPGRGSNDAWVNTFGSGTVAVRRWTLMAAGAALIALGGIIAVAVSLGMRRSSTPVASAALPPPPTQDVRPAALTAAPPAATAAVVAAATGAAPAVTAVAVADVPQVTRVPGPMPVAKGSGTVRAASGKGAKGADKAPEPAPPPPPPPSATAAHRMFGTEN